MIVYVLTNSFDSHIWLSHFYTQLLNVWKRACQESFGLKHNLAGSMQVLGLWLCMGPPTQLLYITRLNQLSHVDPLDMFFTQILNWKGHPKKFLGRNLT